MKTISITTFAVALMAFGFVNFNSTPSSVDFTDSAYAGDAGKTWDYYTTGKRPTVGTGCVDPNTGHIMEGTVNCEQYHSHNEIDELNERDVAESGEGFEERDVADSGNEGSTSAASAGDQ